MNKTLHKELIKKSYYQPHAPIPTGSSLKDDAILSDVVDDMRAFLYEAANDLLQPSPQAIARLLEKARNLR